eukprot:s218_g31.t1
MIKGIHSIKTTYGEGELFGKVEKRGHLTLFREKTMGMLPFSETIAAMIDTIVTFEGPNMMHFRLVTPLGTIRQVKTILPIEPFKQQVEMYWYAERSVPRIIAYLLSLIGKFAVEQDRQVWENKLYWKNPVVVEGDGPFMDFFEWYNQFYSESSAKIGRHQYEWSAQRFSAEGFTNVVQSIPMWKPEGFVSVFGNAIWMGCLHHYLPSMISPLEPQREAPGNLGHQPGICATALVAWHSETNSECSSDPGGHYCKIQPLYNLNFAPLAWGDGVVALFLLAYPAMAIAAIPIAVITTRNTLGQWLGIPPPDPESPYTTSNILLTLSVVVPPFTVALITTDVQALL